MVKENYIIQIIHLNMKEILLMEDLKEMESIYSLMEIIILASIKVQCKMVKAYYIIKMEI